MDSYTSVNAVFLCLVNVVFMIAGIFLNSVVIITLKRSSQLRKKLCYFTILLLSCFDIAVVTITHPNLIFSAVSWCTDDVEDHRKLVIRMIVASDLTGLSSSALLALSVERYLAIKYPFFHQTAVTKKRLGLFLAFLAVVIVSLSSLLFLDTAVIRNVVFVFVLSFLLLIIYFNYNMFIIAKSKDKSRSTRRGEAEGNPRRKFNLKQISTCLIAVGCFFICSFPLILYSVLRCTYTLSQHGQYTPIFRFWAMTFVSMNSTLNCVIFFWRNSVLRREGMKIVGCFRSARSPLSEFEVAIIEMRS